MGESDARRAVRDAVGLAIIAGLAVTAGLAVAFLGAPEGVRMATVNLAYIEITIARDREVAVITMNRPEKRNALSLSMMRELDGALAAAGQDVTVRAVVLRGEGPAFSAGHDLRELLERDVETYRAIFDACVALMARIAGNSAAGYRGGR